MLNLKIFAWGMACLLWVLMSGCKSATPMPAPTDMPLPSDTALPTLVPTWTFTPIPPTITRFPTRTKVTPSATARLLPVMTHTSTVSDKSTEPVTLTPKFELPKGTPTPTPVQNTLIPTLTRTSTVTATEYDAGILTSQTLQDKTIVSASKSFQVTFTFKNTGASTWTGDYGLKWVSGLTGYNMYPANVVPVPRDVHPGETVDLTITCQAPAKPGSAFSMWFFQDMSTGFNFAKAYIEVEVH